MSVWTKKSSENAFTEVSECSRKNCSVTGCFSNFVVYVTIERDYNAALNILDEGLRIIGSSTTEFTLVDYPTMDDRLSNEALKSSGRLKQEVNNEQV